MKFEKRDKCKADDYCSPDEKRLRVHTCYILWNFDTMMSFTFLAHQIACCNTINASEG